MGHEVLWVVHECLSGEVLCARALLSSTQDDLAQLLEEVKRALPVAVLGVVSDGQQSLRKAIARTFPDVPHGLCHFHYLRDAAGRIDGRHHPRLLSGGAQRHHRRWPSTAYRFGSAPARASDSHCQQPGANRGLPAELIRLETLLNSGKILTPTWPISRIV